MKKYNTIFDYTIPTWQELGFACFAAAMGGTLASALLIWAVTL